MVLVRVKRSDFKSFTNFRGGDRQRPKMELTSEHSKPWKFGKLTDVTGLFPCKQHNFKAATVFRRWLQAKERPIRTVKKTIMVSNFTFIFQSD